MPGQCWAKFLVASESGTTVAQSTTGKVKAVSRLTRYYVRFDQISAQCYRALESREELRSMMAGSGLPSPVPLNFHESSLNFALTAAISSLNDIYTSLRPTYWPAGLSLTSGLKRYGLKVKNTGCRK